MDIIETVTTFPQFTQGNLKFKIEGKSPTFTQSCENVGLFFLRVYEALLKCIKQSWLQRKTPMVPKQGSTLFHSFHSSHMLVNTCLEVNLAHAAREAAAYFLANKLFRKVSSTFLLFSEFFCEVAIFSEIVTRKDGKKFPSSRIQPAG